MKYQVPQFIEIEDKIFGPLTFKQFIYLIGGAGFTVIMFQLFPFFLAFIVSAPVVILALTLSFYKVNNKPFILTLEAAVRYFFGGKLYIWKKEQDIKKQKKTSEIALEKAMYIPKLSDSKLGDIAWGLDINENIEK